MSDKLKINRYSEKPMTVKERKALHNLGYIQSDLKGMSFEERTNIINNQIKAPTRKTPVELKSANLLKIERQSFSKLKKVANRLGVTTEQLINAEYTSPLYNKDKSKPMWSRKDRTINPFNKAFYTSSGTKLKGLKIDGIPLQIGIRDAKTVSNYRQNLRTLNQYNEKHSITNENPEVEVKGNTQEDINKWDQISKVQSKLEINNSDSNKSQIMIGNQKGEKKQPADTSPFTYFA